MARTKLRNRYLKNRSKENKPLLRKKKKQMYFISTKYKERILYLPFLNENEITDNKKFWKTEQPFLYNGTISLQRIVLNENDDG